MADLDAALRNLGFERATGDATRARLLLAIQRFAADVEDPDLKAGASALAPVANPFVPPKAWLRGFVLGFEDTADDERGTDPDGGDMQGHMLWQMSSDEWRRARVADLEAQGREDGEAEAAAHNNLT
ncbi:MULTISPECIES: hypothetical protein [unclassified Variovorax]|uniref:hypothetical protein n=1 Tax=unclassified Variovorax TaxID=663243 RepID=UPI00131734C0|nr:MULTISPECIES: hypothetical protein [unclassified Variovorax]VTU42954.1 hypothetical protein H6P1_00321 [Variovorax sp. PBL-H6]VTU43560.1 hypothetical protein SRS16P1_00584 [Variovorax sp. SRS16]VTU43621.1 hypothetical protein E5P1_00578 [Variovorax sp. PBL-E5]